MDIQPSVMFFKLCNGESLISYYDLDLANGLYYLYNPFKYKDVMTPHPYDGSMKMTGSQILPWLECETNNPIPIKLSSVLGAVSPSDRDIEMYNSILKAVDEAKQNPNLGINPEEQQESNLELVSSNPENSKDKSNAPLDLVHDDDPYDLLMDPEEEDEE